MLLLWLTLVGPDMRKHVKLDSLDVGALTAAAEQAFQSELKDLVPDSLTFQAEWRSQETEKVSRQLSVT